MTSTNVSFVDNNDGITIVDLTDQANPSYCFNIIGGPPLTAEFYVREYYPQTVDLTAVSHGQAQSDDGTIKTERMVLQSISALEGVPLMSVDSLVEAWPEEYTDARQAMIDAGTYVPNAESPDESLPYPTTASVPSLHAQPAVQSLADISLRLAVLRAVSEGDVQLIQDALSVPVPGQSKVIFDALCEISPLPQEGAELLELVIGRNQPSDALDLSGTELSPSAVLGLVKARGSTLRKLDLSGNNRITAHDIASILSATPEMQQLTMFDCALISDEDIYGLLAFSPKSVYNLELIGHSAFFRRAQDTEPSCPYVPAFTCIVMHDSYAPYVASIPYFTPGRLLRSLYTLLKPAAAASAASAELALLDAKGQAEDRTLGALVYGIQSLFTSTAPLYAALTTWYEGTVSVTEAIRMAKEQVPDPSGLRANTQRITLIPQKSVSWDGWLLLIETQSYMTPGRFTFARRRQNAASTELKENEAGNAALDLEMLSFGEFVKALQEEGRPAPLVEDVAALADVMGTAFPRKGGDNWFDSADVVKTLNKAKSSPW